MVVVIVPQVSQTWDYMLSKQLSAAQGGVVRHVADMEHADQVPGSPSDVTRCSNCSVTVSGEPAASEPLSIRSCQVGMLRRSATRRVPP